MHRTLKAEATRPPGRDLVEQQVKLDEFTLEYNQIRPHRALDLETPASVYEPSPRPFPEVLPTFEYPSHFRVRKVHGNGCMIWRGEHTFVSHVLENERVGLEAVDDGLWSVHLGPVLLARFDEREKRLYK
jgi:putative transposase